MQSIPPYHTAHEEPEGARIHRAAVVLVHFGCPDVTRTCLDSLLNHEGPTLPIVITDHGPGTPLARILPSDQMTSSLTILESANDGFGLGCNLAAERAFADGAEWVWFLNNDTSLQAPVLTRLVALAKAFPEVGLWGTYQRQGSRLLGVDELPKWFAPPTGSSRDIDRLPPDCKQLKAHQTLSGASILVSRKTWELLGPWPDWCFLYHEDVAWCIRAHQLGIPMALAPLEITHTRNTNTGRRSSLTTYYGVRNRLLLHAAYWPEARWTRYGQWIHLLQKRFFSGHWKLLGPTLRGIRDAARGARFKA